MANGRAKTECSNLIMSSVRRKRCRIIQKLPFYLERNTSLKLPLPDCGVRVTFGTCAGNRKGVCRMLEAFALSDKGCVRTNNEDYCLIEPDLGLYVLADGMGGAKAGERASRMAVETVAERVLFAQSRDSQVLLSAVEEANRRVLEAAQSDS